MELRIATRWTDFDALGHLTHAAYPVFLDEARDAYLRATVGSFTEWPNVIVHLAVDFRREVRFPADAVLLRTSVTEVGRTSITFEQEVTHDGQVAATARAVVVAWDEANRTARPIGAADRDRLLDREVLGAGDEHALDVEPVVEHDDVGGQADADPS
jgi:YbgC/YbaW family acyl-CoA thioester hydrolase